jgi:hypothetical protein
MCVGYLPFPGDLTGSNDEMGEDWAHEADRLDALNVAMRPADWDNKEQYAAYERDYNAFWWSLSQHVAERSQRLLWQGIWAISKRLIFGSAQPMTMVTSSKIAMSALCNDG